MQKARRRRVLLDRAAVSGTVLLLLLAAGGFVASMFGPGRGGGNAPEFGGIACADVRELLPQYADGSLDAATADKIDQHLQACPHCRPLAEEMLTRMQEVSQFLWRAALLATNS